MSSSKQVMMLCLSLDLDPRTEMYPEAVMSCWRSKNTYSPTLVDGGEELVTWRSALCILPTVQARQEP